jgi:hypothetical protein
LDGVAASFFGACRGVVLSGEAEVLFFGAALRQRPFEATRGARGAERGESRGGYWEGESSESLNPMDGSGTKQGQEDRGGTRRQEVEKT